MHPNCTARLVAAEFLHPQGRLCHLRPPGLLPSAAQPQAPHLPSLAYLPSGTICLAMALTEPAAAAATADQATLISATLSHQKEQFPSHPTLLRPLREHR